MPSPIAHAFSGYVLGHCLPIQSTRLRDQTKQRLQPLLSFAALYSMAISVLPDVDFVPQAITGLRFHRGPTHSLLAALVVSLICAWGLHRYRPQRQRTYASGYWNLFGLTFALYGLHLLLDMVTVGGEGMQLLWPFSEQYFRAPFSLFVGVRHSRGLWDSSHWVFITTELIYSALLVAGLWFFQSRPPSNGPQNGLQSNGPQAEQSSSSSHLP